MIGIENWKLSIHVKKMWNEGDVLVLDEGDVLVVDEYEVLVFDEVDVLVLEANP